MIDSLSAQFEKASASYAEDNGIARDRDWFFLKMTEELGEVAQAWNRLTGRGRSHGRSQEELHRALADETADLLGHVLLFVAQNKLDLRAAIARKWHFTPSA